MKKHPKSPKIYRFFTDSLRLRSLFKALNKHRKPIRKLVILYIGAIMIFLLGISTYDLYANYQNRQKIDLERQEITENIEKWQKILEKYQDYRDGYFQLAILEYRLKEFNKSKFYLDKVLEQDPNFMQARMLQEILNTK